MVRFAGFLSSGFRGVSQVKGGESLAGTPPEGFFRAYLLAAISVELMSAS